jgi:hypothetical protein
MTKMIAHSFQTRSQVLFGNDIGCQAKYMIYMVTYLVGPFNPKKCYLCLRTLGCLSPRSQKPAGLEGALPEVFFIPSPPVGERVRVRGELIAFSPFLIVL